MVQLGPFDVQRRLGKGGMCEVWKGVHRTQQTPVAIKVISEQLAKQPRYLQGFREEVRSVAGLSHPSIVMVFDYGQIPQSTSEQSQGQLHYNSPYLVMEMGEGSLQPFRGRLSWGQLYPILLSILDALAHAHAREIIHRDIKPDNILFFDDCSKAKLADFGLAFTASEHGELAEELAQLAGTPTFMAPEQFEVRWRDYGPWTDLYALGCTVFAMLAGRAPYGNKGGLQALMFAHMCEPIPHLGDEIDVPPGFQLWLNKMMAKHPGERFQRAADAAWALMEFAPSQQGATSLDEIDEGTINLHASDIVGFMFDDEEPYPSDPTHIHAGHIPQEEGPISLIMDPTLNVLVSWDVDNMSLDQFEKEWQNNLAKAPARSDSYEDIGINFNEQSELVESSHGAMPLSIGSFGDGPAYKPTTIASSPKRRMEQLPPLPDKWNQDLDEVKSIQLTEVGLGLFGMRTIPLIGREKEKAQLWDTLHHVTQHKEARFVLLRGPSGCGKSRLAEALCSRAHELGVGTPMRAVHNEFAGPVAGLGPMIERNLFCVGLRQGEILGRLQELSENEWRVNPKDVDALAEVIAPNQEEEESALTMVRFSLPTERYTTIERYLAKAAKERPVLLWLDDIQWGLDSLQFVKHLLERQELNPFPILIMATAREESLVEREVESKFLDDLMGQSQCLQIDIGPLNADAHAQLVRELLLLQGELARMVEERTAGNPLFALQLVGDWVQQGALVCGEEGFRLREGVELSIPDDLYDVWGQRIDNALQGRPSWKRSALEIAATLGLEIDGQEWRQVCRLANLRINDEIVENLLSQRLAVCRSGHPDEGWSLVHTMLREALIRDAKESGKWASYNRLCAAMLEGRRSGLAQERQGRHLLEAGLHEAAIAPLLNGLHARIEAHELFVVRQLLDEWIALLHKVSWPTHHHYWGEAWLLEAKYARGTSYYEVATQWARQAVDEASAHNWPELYAESLMWFAYYTWLSGGAADSCRQWLQEAFQYAKQLNARKITVQCTRLMGDFLASRAELEEAKVYFQSSLKESIALRDQVSMGRAYHGMAMVERQAGEHELSWQWTEHAHKAFLEGGHRRGVVDCLNVFGDLSRLQGELKEAENFYVECIELTQALGTGNEALFELNLGLTLNERAQFAKAREILTHSLESLTRQKRILFAGVAHLSLLPSLAYQRDWNAWEEHVTQAKELLTGSGFSDVDLAKTATMAGDLARHAGAFNRAKESYELAKEQWKSLERQTEVEMIDSRLSQLEGAKTTII